jgi:thymidine kinase
MTVPEEITIIGSAKSNITSGIVSKRNYEKMASWVLKGKEGEHVIEISYKEEKQQHSVLITDENKYLPALKQAKGSIKSISVDYKKKVLIPIGFRDWLGWLGVYIWCSIIFTMALRKVLKVY